MTRGRPKLATLLAIGLLYAVAGKAGGLLGGARPGEVLPVWPAAGIALAAAVLLGRRCWPAIFAGALASELLIGTSLAAAIGAALGNTVEPVAGALLLERARFDPGLRRVRDVVRLLVAAVLLSPVAGSLLGASSYRLFGRMRAGSYPAEWFTWWLGDAVGVLLVAPAILVWRPGQPARADWRRLPEGLALIAALVAVSVFISFSGRPNSSVSFLLAPVLLWAAVRFEQRGAALASLLSAAIAVAAVALGAGPFRGMPDERARLLMLQLFVAVHAVVALVVAAAIDERRVALRAREDFIAVASHELRTPLTPLRLTLQRLRRADCVDAPFEREVRGALLAMAERQVDRLVTLVGNLLDASRAASGKLALEREEVDLGELVRETAARFEADSQRARCPLQVQTAPGVIGSWDRRRLEQVVANLMSNALKFGAGKPVDVRVGRLDGRGVVEVCDHGVGLSPEDQQRIFERYAQAPARADTVGGLGLGLFISREIVERLGGEIRVRSHPGEGAAFRIELPLR